MANWTTAVAPKLAALERAVGGREQAEALLRAVPEALKYPAESRLAPNLRLLTKEMGLQGEVSAGGRCVRCVRCVRVCSSLGIQQ